MIELIEIKAKFSTNSLTCRSKERMNISDLTCVENGLKWRWKRYQVLGRSFFYPTFGKGQLGDGLEYWKGYYQSLRPTQMGLSLNIDMSARAFYESVVASDYVAKYLNRDLASARPFSDQERIQDNVKEAKSKRKSGEVSSNTTENDKFSEVFGKDQRGHVRGGTGLDNLILVGAQTSSREKLELPPLHGIQWPSRNHPNASSRLVKSAE
ncbi:hypothetical protein LguiB_027695 [Lonicera macranthoides]